MANHILGVYYCPNHGRQSDVDYIKQLQPNNIRILEADVGKMNSVYEYLPNAIYFPRRWEITEDSNKVDMQNNPVETGKKHANFWRNKINEWKANGLNVPENQMVVVGINEPSLHKEEGMPSPKDNPIGWQKWVDETKHQIDIVTSYNVATIKEANNLGLRFCTLNASVGNPTNFRNGELVWWDGFLPLYEVIKNSKHFLCVHEYWWSSNNGDYTGINNGWGWYAGRIQQNHWKDVNIIIGECGVEHRLDYERMQREGKQWGWQGALTEQQYAKQLVNYTAHLQQDKRIKGIFCFLTDVYSREWLSLDTNPAHSFILEEIKNIKNYPLTLPYDLSWMDKPIEPKPPIILPPITPELTNKKLIYPLDVVNITQHFGKNPQNYARFGLDGHNGTDFGANANTPIKAMTDGIVEMVEFDVDYGNYVRLWHPQLNICTFYAHMIEKSKLTIGKVVKQGDIIGRVGSTGNSTGFHLHTEVRLMKTRTEYQLTGNGFGNKGQIDPYAIIEFSKRL